MRVLFKGSIIFSLLSISFMWAQPKRIIRNDILIKSKVEVNLVDSGYFLFSYIFESDLSSKQLMHRVNIDLDDDWVEYGGTVRKVIYPKEKDWGEYPELGVKIRWVTYYDTSGLDFLEQPPRSAIRPGEKLSFSFEAKGLPGIGTFTAAGWAKWFFTEEEEDSLIAIGYTEEGVKAIDENFFKGTTIVRRSLPLNFIPSVWLDTLISYKHQSRTFGWIDNDGIVNSLDQKLENAKKQLEKGNTNSAKNMIQAFINEVEAQNGKHLTSEAYALLKYNAEYLLEKMGGK